MMRLTLLVVFLVATVASAADVFVNGGGARAMRAPGHPQGCFIMESAMDDLAEALGQHRGGVGATVGVHLDVTAN